jgi:hypothetical protein
LRAEHHAVDNQSVFVAEDLRKADRAIMAFEGKVFRDFTAKGKGAAKCGNALNVTPELDLFGEQRVASLAVSGALVRKLCFIPCGELYRRNENGVVGHAILLGETCRVSVHFDNPETRPSRISFGSTTIRKLRDLLGDLFCPDVTIAVAGKRS